ncbi:MAG: hypothetical protein R3B95_12725 [Nitrospirales bacterium]|nr:hypothetical protein [Nitrospirales bacterium]
MHVSIVSPEGIAVKRIQFSSTHEMITRSTKFYLIPRNSCLRLKESLVVALSIA